MRLEVTQRLLHEMFIIDFEAGTMIRRSTGIEAGYLELPRGYWMMRVAGASYKRSRLMYLAFHGEWPVPVVDHINRITSDDRIINLRRASFGENQRNRWFERREHLPFPQGVSRSRKRFVAQVTFDGQRIYIGSFPTPDDAHKAYLAKRQELFGEFA